jgi:ribonuclease HI
MLDGSVINGNATWAFIIATTDGHQLTSPSGKVRGHNITSFRAELSGILAAFIATRDFAPDTRYTVYCDNQSFITRLNIMKSIRPQVSWSDYDLLYTCLINYPKQVVFEHVRGHQDTAHTGKVLSNLAQLNILMDSLAALAHTDPNIPQETRHTSTICLTGKVLTGKLTTSLRNEINTLQITNYYKQKFGENYDTVLRDVFYSAVLHYKQLPKSHCVKNLRLSGEMGVVTTKGKIQGKLKDQGTVCMFI